MMLPWFRPLSFPRLAPCIIAPDAAEIAKAAWWSVETLPKLPPAQSISARLIKRYVSSKLGAAEAAM